MRARRVSKAQGRQEARREGWKELKIQSRARRPGTSRGNAAADKSAAGEKQAAHRRANLQAEGEGRR